MRNSLEIAVTATFISVALAACEPAPQSSEKTVAPPAAPHVLVEPIKSQPAPSDSGKVVVLPAIAEPNHVPPTLLGLPEKTILSERARNLQRILEYPTIISVGGRSFKEFMQEKGYEYSVHELKSPLIGRVVPPEGLITRPLPTTAATVRSLSTKHSLRSNARIELQTFVRVTKVDGSREEIWVARYERVSTPGNPDIEMPVFNAVQIRKGSETAQYITLNNR